MARPTYLTTDPASLKPIAEALIFASEEPLAARLLVRFLAGEREEEKKVEVPVGNGEVGIDDAGNPEPVEQSEQTEQSGQTEPVELAQPIEADAIGENPFPEAGDTVANGMLTNDGSQRENVTELAEAIERAEDRASGMLLGEGFGEPIDQRLLRRLIDELNAEYQESGRAFRIVEIAGGFQFATIREYGEYVALLSREKSRRRLSPAALETLAIIAYRQPVSKPELESIRGVNSDQVLLSLLEKNLIAITGRADSVGRPLLYGTTSEFLRIFGLNSLSDLPRLREIEELMEEDAYSADRVEVITVAESSEVEEIEARVGAAGRTEAAENEPSGEPMRGIELAEIAGEPSEDPAVLDAALPESGFMEEESSVEPLEPIEQIEDPEQESVSEGGHSDKADEADGQVSPDEESADIQATQ